jgi:predicted CopG family antitoxin
MAAKTVALDAEAYALLLRSKRAGETFSEVVRRMLRPPSRVSELAGSLRDLPPKEWKDIERARAAQRRRDAVRKKRFDRGGASP